MRINENFPSYILDAPDVVLAIIFFTLIIIVASSTYFDFKLKLRNLGCKRHSEHYKNPVMGSCMHTNKRNISQSITNFNYRFNCNFIIFITTKLVSTHLQTPQPNIKWSSTSASTSISYNVLCGYWTRCIIYECYASVQSSIYGKEFLSNCDDDFSEWNNNNSDFLRNEWLLVITTVHKTARNIKV